MTGTTDPQTVKSSRGEKQAKVNSVHDALKPRKTQQENFRDNSHPPQQHSNGSQQFTFAPGPRVGCRLASAVEAGLRQHSTSPVLLCFIKASDCEVLSYSLLPCFGCFGHPGLIKRARGLGGIASGVRFGRNCVHNMLRHTRFRLKDWQERETSRLQGPVHRARTEGFAKRVEDNTLSWAVLA